MLMAVFEGCAPNHRSHRPTDVAVRHLAGAAAEEAIRFFQVVSVGL